MKYVSITSCDGVKSGAVFPDLEMCLQHAAEDIFGEVPDADSDHAEEWGAIEKTLIEDNYIAFEDGSISIAEIRA
jgi:hypothetical protein